MLCPEICDAILASVAAPRSAVRNARTSLFPERPARPPPRGLGRRRPLTRFARLLNASSLTGRGSSSCGERPCGHDRCGYVATRDRRPACRSRRAHRSTTRGPDPPARYGTPLTASSSASASTTAILFCPGWRAAGQGAEPCGCRTQVSITSNPSWWRTSASTERFCFLAYGKRNGRPRAVSADTGYDRRRKEAHVTDVSKTKSVDVDRDRRGEDSSRTSTSLQGRPEPGTLSRWEDDGGYIPRASRGAPC
jgi:hypothetical protein